MDLQVKVSQQQQKKYEIYCQESKSDNGLIRLTKISLPRPGIIQNSSEFSAVAW